MNTILTPELRALIEATHYRPAVSIILPFEPKMGAKASIIHSLKLATDKVEKELKINYPDEMGKIVMIRLRKICKNLDFTTHKKSLAIYVSPVFEKVLYLNIEVEEKVIVDESFEIRDLVYSKKQLHKYLVLVLSSKESKIFIGNSNTMLRIFYNTVKSMTNEMDDIAERVANFSDKSDRKEIMADKFLHYVDTSLTNILKVYNLPLFVAGTEKVLGHFTKISKHANAIVDYVHGNFEEATSNELLQILAPHVVDWKKVKQKELLHVLDDANAKNKIAFGIINVWREAANRKGRLLLVEKDYMFAAEHGVLAEKFLS